MKPKEICLGKLCKTLLMVQAFMADVIFQNKHEDEPETVQYLIDNIDRTLQQLIENEEQLSIDLIENLSDIKEDILQ
ncbi:unnamed protein product [Rotaria sp. Silwood2]|nr:unnamed protein product [Rotaria sp. Silwood2]CAF4347048.1 unnamed protein product [Rotaria sp. Silwood2]CAF4581093.1 unnamed protein product [Rotaria sp. Silwood2]